MNTVIHIGRLWTRRGTLDKPNALIPRRGVAPMIDWMVALVVTLIVALMVALTPSPAAAQSSCSSDGQAAPRVILERFINADCAACWRDNAVAPTPLGGLAIDWILPGSQGEDAPLSAVASRDAAWRLEALNLAMPTVSLNHSSAPRRVQRPAQQALDPHSFAPHLRVARGIALNGYMGASIELTLSQKQARQPAQRGPWTAWLVLVEAIPRGTEGSAVDRLLVRNTLTLSWNAGTRLSKKDQVKQGEIQTFFESRPMSLPPGTNPEHLRVVGWVENSRKQVITSAVSSCDYPK